MSIAAELHKTEEEIADWPLEKVADWQAFFRLRSQALERMSKRNPQIMGDKRTVVEEL